uniref:Uncharacterized protein n=1 Tax=Arundo donax TaxID=35708 RepID=A0A0A8ZTI3_ARUDO
MYVRTDPVCCKFLKESITS